MDAILFKMVLDNEHRDIISLYRILENHLFDESKDEGYSDLLIESKTYISGTILNKMPTLLNVFDIESQTIIRKEEIIVNRINFSIDIENNLFEIFSSSIRDAKRAYTTINHTLKNEIKLYPYNITIADILLHINNGFEDIDFQRLNIKNFKIENYAEGYFEIKNTENSFAWSLVENYKKDIIKAILTINYETEIHSLSISENGKIKLVSKNKSKTKVFFETLKEMIFKIN